MLDEYRRLYENKADSILKEDWRKADKSYLFFKHLEHEKDDALLSEGYLAAVIARYWNLINSYYARGRGAYDAETCYEWLIHCIQYAKDHKPWAKGGNLEGQHNAPDKCINIYMSSMRQGFYQWSNAKKRADYFTQTTSLNKMTEETGDANLPIVDDTKALDEYLDIKNLVVKEFKSKNYMSSFLIDGIVNTACIDTIKEKNDPYIYTQFNRKKLSRHIRSMDDDYCSSFSKQYELPSEEVLLARDECKKVSSTKIYNLLNNTLTKLSKNLLVKN